MDSYIKKKKKKRGYNTLYHKTVLECTSHPDSRHETVSENPQIRCSSTNPLLTRSFKEIHLFVHILFIQFPASNFQSFFLLALKS